MKIYIDDRENKRIDSAIKFFLGEEYELGKNLMVSHLKYGDYIFRDNNINVIFEYKRVDDYINSLADYRVFNQAINQSRNYDYHFVIIVGTEKERKKAIDDAYWNSGRIVTNKQFYGSIASLVNFTSIIQVPNEDTAFMVMLQVAEHCCNLKPVIKRFKKSYGSPALRLLSNTVNGIGYKKAEAICDTLGLYSVEDVIRLDVESLVKVDGIGKKGAESVLGQLKGEFS